MIRTQIYIPETLHERVKSVARANKQSLADLYREFILKGLSETKSRSANLATLANLKIKAGPKNLSRDMDKYLYGGKK